jgi:hypothetical protein
MFLLLASCWPPLSSNGQSSWLQIQRSRVRLPALPDFLRSSLSGTMSTQPREDNWGASWMEKSRKSRLTAVGIRCANHATPLYPQTLALTSPTSGGRSVDIVRLRTKATEFLFCFVLVCLAYSSTLKVEATCSSRKSADFQWTTWRYIP